jgi:hypothetical protein
MGKQQGRRTRSDRGDPDTRGWPTHEHNMWTPMGHVEQFGNALRAVRYTDRHRGFSRAVLALIVAPFLIAAVVAIGAFVHDAVWGSDSVPEPQPPPPFTAPAQPP